MKPITPFDSFPSFGNGGSRSAPGDAKYALGFVPADTFPAEWANYFFHGATKGVSDLNSAVTSLWNEMGAVLSNYNITPDATDNDQLLECLTKLKAEAALAAHPVGSLYWTSVNENPATTFDGGTWEQIKDKFILAAGDTYSQGATGGSATVTLTTDQIPSHDHSFTPSGKIASTANGNDNKTASESSHTHGYSHTHKYTHTHEYTPSGKIASTSGGSDNKTSAMSGDNYAQFNPWGYRNQMNPLGRASQKEDVQNWHSYNAPDGGNGPDIYISLAHTHNAYFTGTKASTTSQSANTTTDQSATTTGAGSAHSHTAYFTGTAGTTGTRGGGAAHDNMPPYIVQYCWRRTA
jgi:microcystin-dependent protein